MNTVIFTGSAALDYIDSDEFLLKWKALHDACPWATACQHPDFVIPWYKLYQARFVPVVVLAQGHDDSLTGLLTLALHRGEKKMTGAGERQAEYQGWLAAADIANEFMHNATQKIRATFGGVNLYLKYLPAGIPLDWINHAPELKKVCALRSHRRPIMKIDEAAMARQRNKKNFRQNYNRLKRIGTVHFERVTTHEHFIKVIDEICVQYDLRQGVLHHNMPFSNDPSKKLFYMELHKRGLLHTTVLTVGGAIAASHSGLISNEHALHVGITTHAPVFAAHSPGNLLLATLGVHLAQEKISLLDLTPGGDGYKENFATEHDTVFELTIYSDAVSRMKIESLQNVRQLVKTALSSAGYRGADALAALTKLDTFRCALLARLLMRAQHPPKSRNNEDRQKPEHGAIAGDLMISKNCLNDVIKFAPLGTSGSGWTVLRNVVERMERANHFYSLASESKLLISCWTRIGSSDLETRRLMQDDTPADDGVAIFDLHVHRQYIDRELVEQFILQLLDDLNSTGSATALYYSGQLDAGLRPIMEKCLLNHASGMLDLRDDALIRRNSKRAIE